MNELLHLDRQLFFIINHYLQNDLMDWLMPYWREKTTWIPLYFGLAIWWILRFRKIGIFLLLMAGVSVGIADLVSSRFIKTNVQRLRPCNEPTLKEDVRLLVPCGSGYSFTSSHSANHFALALFIFLTVGKVYPVIKWPALIWAASIAIGQVYVGVHYPLDILAGGIVGAGIAAFFAWLSNRYFPVAPVIKRVST